MVGLTSHGLDPGSAPAWPRGQSQLPTFPGLQFSAIKMSTHDKVRWQSSVSTLVLFMVQTTVFEGVAVYTHRVWCRCCVCVHWCGCCVCIVHGVCCIWCHMHVRYSVICILCFLCFVWYAVCSVHLLCALHMCCVCVLLV